MSLNFYRLSVEVNNAATVTVISLLASERARRSLTENNTESASIDQRHANTKDRVLPTFSPVCFIRIIEFHS